jgi:hypothetical protein
MTTYTDTEAKRNLDVVLDQARQEGEIRIKRLDGQEFILRPAETTPSPLDVGRVPVRLSTDEIVQAVREGRER